MDRRNSFWWIGIIIALVIVPSLVYSWSIRPRDLAGGNALTAGSGIKVSSNGLTFESYSGSGDMTAAVYDADSNNVVDTATALAANPTDCGANTYATTIAANGNLTCASIVDADVPDTITASNYLPLAGGKITGNTTIDDDTTDSPSFSFVDSDNETAAFVKKQGAAGSGYLQLTTAADDGLQIITGNLRVGDGAPGQTLNGEDAYVNGLLEVDGMIYADGGITGTLTGGASLSLPLAGGTLTGNLVLDDGAGNSPTITFQDVTDETVVLEKVDSGYLTVTTAAADGVNILVGNLKVGDGAPGQTINGEDAYINGLLEVDGMIYADGGVTGTLTGTSTGLAGTPNITVGTLSAGAGGFTVDADGDLTAVKSITVTASASPAFTFNDSDSLGADKESAQISSQYIDGADGAENSTMDLAVMVAGTRTTYIQLDGKNTDVEINAAVVTTAAVTVGTTLAVGTDPADAGTIRLPNAGSLVWEDAAEASITHVDNTGWLLNDAMQLQFRDSGIYVYSAADTFLDLVADGGVRVGNTQFKLPTSNADPTAAAGYIRHDSTVTNHANGALRWHDGTNIRHVVDMVAATAEGCTNAYVVAYDSTNDLFYCKEDATAGAPTLDTIGDPAAATSISVDNDEGITIESAEDTGTILLIKSTDADLAGATSIVDLSFNDDGQANGWFMRGYDNAYTDLKWSIGAGGNFLTLGQFQVGDTATYLYQPADGYVGLIGDTGVRLTASDEDLQLIDAGANNIAITSSSGVTDITLYGATTADPLNFATTGTIRGAIKVIDMGSTAATYTVLAADAYGSEFKQTHDDGATVVTLTDYQASADVDHVKVGASMCFMTKTAFAMVVTASADDKIRSSAGVLSGAAGTCTGPATIGAYACFILDETDTDVGIWQQMGTNGAWVTSAP